MYSWTSPFERANPDAEFNNGGEVLSVKGSRLHTILSSRTAAGDDCYDTYHLSQDCYAQIIYDAVIEDGDEVWSLFGSADVWVLRKVRATFKLVCKAKLETASGADYEPDVAWCIPTRIDISCQQMGNWVRWIELEAVGKP